MTRSATSARGPSGDTPLVNGRSSPTYPSSAVPPPRLRCASAEATAAVSSTTSSSPASSSASIASSSSSSSFFAPPKTKSSGTSGGVSNASAKVSSPASPESRSHSASAVNALAGYQHHFVWVSVAFLGVRVLDSFSFSALAQDAAFASTMDVSSNFTGLCLTLEETRDSAPGAAVFNEVSGVCATSSSLAMFCAARESKFSRAVPPPTAGSLSSFFSKPGFSTKTAPIPAFAPKRQYLLPVLSIPIKSGFPQASRTSFTCFACAPKAGESTAKLARH